MLKDRAQGCGEASRGYLSSLALAIWLRWEHRLPGHDESGNVSDTGAEP